MKREQELTRLTKKVKKRMESEPLEGVLEICHIRGRTCYYRKSAEEKQGKRVYIPQSQKDVAEQLAQQAYDRKVLKELEKELGQVRALMKGYQTDHIGAIYSRMNESRRQLIQPVIPTQEEFVRQWYENTIDRKNSYPVPEEFYTDRGEYVRSKSELYIANKLNSLDIPYKYEAALELRSPGSLQEQFLYPDFTVLNRRTGKTYYWEHLGMMGQEQYVQDALKKFETYEMNGYYPGDSILITHESAERPLNTRLVQSIIQHFLL